jgi:hypothetical protein
VPAILFLVRRMAGTAGIFIAALDDTSPLAELSAFRHNAEPPCSASLI